MFFFRTLLIGIGIVILVVVLITAVIAIIQDVDYKRQLNGKRPMREYKGNLSYNCDEEYKSDLEIDKASKEKTSFDQISHRP